MGFDEQKSNQEPIATDDRSEDKQKAFQQAIEDQEHAVIDTGFDDKQGSFEQIVEDQENDVIDYSGGKRKRGQGGAKRGLLVGCLVGLLACGACVIFFVGMFYALLWPVLVSCRDFTNALYEQDYVTAYNLLTEDYQNQFGSPEGLRQQLEAKQYQLAERWTLTSFRNINVENNTGEYAGQVKLTDGRIARLNIRLVKEGGEWRIAEYYFDAVRNP